MKTLHQRRTFLFATVILPLIFLAISCRKDNIVKDGGMPGQAKSGPGGSEYPYPKVTKIAYQSNGVENYIFQPSPRPKNALPVIAFQHAFNIYPGNQLDRHTGLINHLVRKGYTVIYDEFQPELTTDPKTFENNAAIIIKDGLKFIKEHPEILVPVSLSKSGLPELGLIGYSVGGATSINLTANYRQNGIPKPTFLFTLVANNGGGNTTPMRDAGTIDPDTKVVIIDVEDDGENTFITSSNCWNQISQIPAANKQWIGVFSDKNPTNPAQELKADHYSPASDSPDALDFNGFFKWATALANFSFYGKDYRYWWGNTPEATFMGNWSDGSEVKRAKTGQVAFWPGH